MRTILTYFFVTLGVIFFLLCAGGVYIWYTDTWGVQTIVSFVQSHPPLESGAAPSSGTPSQREALEAAGLDPSLFADLSDEQVTCLEEAIGPSRMEAIRAGALPTAGEILAGGECL